MSAKVAARIAKLVSEGVDIRTAWDTVLGAGSFESFASGLYDRLREGR
jgi:hypothetical protein